MRDSIRRALTAQGSPGARRPRRHPRRRPYAVTDLPQPVPTRTPPVAPWCLPPSGKLTTTGDCSDPGTEAPGQSLPDEDRRLRRVGRTSSPSSPHRSTARLVGPPPTGPRERTPCSTAPEVPSTCETRFLLDSSRQPSRLGSSPRRSGHTDTFLTRTGSGNPDGVSGPWLSRLHRTIVMSGYGFDRLQCPRGFYV